MTPRRKRPLRATEPEPAGWRPHDTFATRLRLVRWELDISAMEAGRKVQVADTTWLNWERGVSTPANFGATVAFIAARLGCDEQWLAEGGALGSADSEGAAEAG